MISIHKPGMPNQTMHITEDTAQVMLDALAMVLGASIKEYANEPVDVAEVGSVTVTRGH